MRYDLLVLGRGLAGAVLAEACRARGLSFHVLDVARAGSASLAAAGVVNPVVLRRDMPSWRAAALLPLAEACYGPWQQRLRITCWHPLPLVKIFPAPGSAVQWAHALADPGTAPFLASRPEPTIDRAPLRAPHGYGTVTASAWLDVPLLLDAQRRELLRDGQLTEGMVNPDAIQRTPAGVRVGAVEGRWLVYCTGPFAERPGLVPVQGETLTVRIPGLRLSCMVHRGIFLLPLGEDRYRIGATFRWEEVWGGSSEAARTWLLERAQAFVDAPIEVLDQQSGVRPTTRDRRPLLGPIAPGEAVLNGLGARGVLQAPWCAAHLLDHLFADKPLDPEVDHARFPAG